MWYPSSVKSLVAIVTVFPVLLIVGTLAPYFLTQNQTSLNNALLERGNTFLSQISNVSEYGMASGDVVSAYSFIRKLLKQEAELCAVQVKDKHDVILIDENNCSIDWETIRLAKKIEFSSPNIAVMNESQDLNLSFDMASPDGSDNSVVLGHVSISMSLHELTAQQDDLLANGIMITLALLSVSLGLGLWLSRFITRPLSKISENVKRIAVDNYADVHSYSIHGEVGELSESIVAMAKKLEESRDRLNQYLLNAEVAREDAEAANQAKTEFLALISHEVRTPLNATMGMLQILEDTSLSTLQQRYVANALSGAEHLLALINDILDFSTLDLGKVKLENQVCDIESITQQLIENFRTVAEEKGVDLTLSFEGDVDLKRCMVIIDPTRIKQVLINLLGNALKYTERGSVHFYVCSQKKQDKLQLEFRIQDTGIGIPNDKLEQIFSSFKRVEKTTNRLYEGCGLGLSIAKQLVTLMGGEIIVSSELGVGSVFTCLFELDCSFRETASLSDKETPLTPTERILLVEDNQMNRETIVALFAHVGVTIDAVDSSEKALRMLTANHYNLVFVDCHMPKIDGFELVEKIRREESATSGIKRVPIIAITADVQYATKERCFSVGMDDFIAKPVDKFELYRKAALWIRSAAQIQRLG